LNGADQVQASFEIDAPNQNGNRYFLPAGDAFGTGAAALGELEASEYAAVLANVFGHEDDATVFFDEEGVPCTHQAVDDLAETLGTDPTREQRDEQIAAHRAAPLVDAEPGNAAADQKCRKALALFVQHLGLHRGHKARSLDLEGAAHLATRSIAYLAGPAAHGPPEGGMDGLATRRGPGG